MIITGAAPPMKLLSSAERDEVSQMALLTVTDERMAARLRQIDPLPPCKRNAIGFRDLCPMRRAAAWLWRVPFASGVTAGKEAGLSTFSQYQQEDQR